jgi:hypothetical protein
MLNFPGRSPMFREGPVPSRKRQDRLRRACAFPEGPGSYWKRRDLPRSARISSRERRFHAKRRDFTLKSRLPPRTARSRDGIPRYAVDFEDPLSKRAVRGEFANSTVKSPASP